MVDFFRDYGTWVTSSLALINGFIALIIAQFFKDRHIAKVILVSTAAILVDRI
jgi:hypothetical protein